MNPKFFTVTLIISLFFFTTQCTFYNEQVYFEPQVCDTLGITYDSLTYIFSGVCYECHNMDYTNRPGIFMDDYASVKASIETGLVIPAIKHEGPYKMPNNLPKLSDCDIARIEAWIATGMPQ